MKETLKAFSDGINDYVAGVSLFASDATGRTLPLEFIAFGITKESFTPWSPVDSLAIIRLMSF